MTASAINSNELAHNAIELPPSQDRLVFTAFLAILFHALLILGVDFVSDPSSSRAHTLEVTFALHNNPDAPKKADYLAEFNQLGSGSEAEKAEISTDRRADFHSDVVNNVQLKTPTAPKAQKELSKKRIISTSNNSAKTISAYKNKQQELDYRKAPELMLLEKTNKIASLEAQLRKQKQAYAKRPRVRQVTSVTTLAHKEARYLQDFRQRIEETGNRNFPRQALSKKNYGSVRLLVAINKDGSLHEVKLLKSSGYGFLDEAAINSVRLSAPFQPFPPALRKDTDILEIIRTWKFDEQRMVTSNL